MKVDKKIFICTVIVLMMFLCINACSATEPLNQTLGTDISDEIAIDDDSDDVLSVGGSNDLKNQLDDATLADGSADAIYVSVTGNNESDGQSRETAVRTIAKAVELANNGPGKVIILEGTYTESNIEIDKDKSIYIAGEGNVVIDGGSDSNSIFVMHGGEASFTNIKFTNANPSYGGAIFMNSATGTGRDVIDVNVLVDNCTFDDLKTTKRGGAIYALYVQGDIIIEKSNFYNMNVSQWGGAVCVGYSPDVNVGIYDSKFENNSANNGGGAYLQANEVNMVDSTFNNNSATYDSGAVYLYDCIATADKCVLTNNKAGSQGVAVKFTRPTSGSQSVKTLTVTNSVIENNSATDATLPAIYVDMQTLYISYSSLINDLSIETRTGQGYDAVYGQGIAVANNNWWNTNDPTTKVSGKNITVNRWVVMNVEANASQVESGDEVTLTVDFNHVNTTSGVLEELSGGEIPKESYDVKFTAVNGTVEPETLTILKGEVKQATFTAGNVNALVNVKSGEASEDIVFKDESSQHDYHGVIYVDVNGDDNNDGSLNSPVSSIAKAIERANDGLGQIVINEGTYKGNMYHVTKALNVTGKGNVVLDADGDRLFTMDYGDSADWLILTNLTVVGANNYHGQAIYSFADNLILTNLTLTDNPGPGSLIKNNGKLTMDNCVVANHNGGNIIEGGSINITNTVFENNTVTDYAIIYTTSNTNAVIENTTFANNAGRLGIVKVSGKVTVRDSRFTNNTNNVGYGGAINDFDELTVTNSTFIGNKADKDAGAIHVATNKKATITKSVFIDNAAGAGYHGDAVRNAGELTINYCVLLSDGENGIIYSSSEDEVNAKYNWWGTNSNPQSFNGVGTYEDDWGNDVPCEIDSSRWVVMNVATDLTGEAIEVGGNVEITVDFTNYMDLANSLKPLSDSIPEVEVKSGAVNGDLNSTEDVTKDNVVKFIYTAVNPGDDTVTVSSSKASIEIPITVEGAAESVTYVDGANGADANNGKTRETAVKTIEKAVEIADGKIIVLTGEYTVNTLLNITRDLEIIGEGDVTVNSNAKTTITYEEWDDWDEEWVTKTKTIYNLIENNANLNISNIKFTLVPASISDALILNNANLLINTSEFNNIKVTSSKGVIQNIKGATLNVNGTTFKSSSSTYGVISSNGELLVNNSRFLDNDVSSSTGSASAAITAYNKATISNSQFKNNKAAIGGAVYVMYSYTNLVNPVVDIVNCTFDENGASGSYGDGAAVRCSGNQVTLTITNSTFNKNTANRYGGAVYTQGSVTINQCVFTDNSASAGDAIYAYGGTTSVENSIILEDGNAISRYESTYSDPATVTANDNWWGSNDAPANVGSGITVERWVRMDAGFTPISAHAGDDITVTATFDNDKLPEGVIKVTFTSTSGNLNEVVTVNDAQASATYTIDISDVDVTATSGDVSVVMPIEPPAPAGTIYVSYENGDDTSDGLTADTSVKTIAHAIELADAGIGKIILLEGTHVLGTTLQITKDVDIRGIGDVVIDGNNNRFIQNGAGLNITNIGFTNGYSSGSNLIYTSSDGKYLSLENVRFYKNGAKYGVSASAGTRLIINNSQFYDNNLFTANQNSMGVIYSNSAKTTVENTVFRNNTVQKGAGIWASKSSSAQTGSVDVINCTFDGNVAQNGNGAAIFMSGSVIVNVVNSTFTNNLANTSAESAGGYGSAVYIGTGTGKITVSKSVFINNTGNGENNNDAGFYIGAGSLDVSDSIILTNDGDERYAVNAAGGAVTAENNWWGNNDKANTNAKVTNIVKMTATLTPEDAASGDEVTITVAFDNENLPRDVINVTLTSTSGLLNEIITMNGNQASVNYTIDERDLSISVKSSQAEILFPFNPEAGTIFVSPGGDDSNLGTRDAPVATIAKALELAAKGKIVLLEGTHKTGDLGIVSDELNITGEGRAIIDAQNSNRILYVGEDAKVVISNVIMVNGYTIDESGALLGNSNELTLINCTLANSSASQNNGGAIFSVGKLTIINTTIANCTAVRGGAIYTQTEKDGTQINIFNSTFENNIAKGKETWGGGAIYAQRTGAIYEFALTVDNSTFKGNKAQGTSCGGAIQIEQLNSDVKITGSEFISNHANGKDDYGGGAIYVSSPSSYDRQGTMAISDSLFENNTCDSNGGAILAKTTTVTVANSVIINNKDANELAVYGLRSDVTSPSIIMNDNWWGTNLSPKEFVGGNGYRPTINRWAILTVTNDTPIVAGSTVKLTVSINSYTTGTANGTLSKPITVKRSETIKTSFEDITGTLENGEFTYDYTVPENLKFIAAAVDGETQILYALSSPVTVEIADINARKYDKVTVEINVTSDSAVNDGEVELYVNGEKLIATIEVKDSKAIGEVVISENEGIYNLTAKYVNGLPLFEDAQMNATLTVSGTYGLYNETFFNFFDEEGNLRDEITDEELQFHGKFSDLGINIINIPRTISIKGDNAVLKGIALHIQSDDSKVSDIALIADGNDFSENGGAAILVDGENIELNNVSVNYTAPVNVAAYGILAKTSNGFKLLDSTIIFDANNKAGIIQQAGLIIDGSSDVEIKGNKINAALPARDVAYSYSYSELNGIYQDLVLGIGMQDCENVEFTDNAVNVDAKSAEGEFATIDSFMVDTINNLLIKGNNFTQTDFTGVGKAGYANVLDLYNFEGVTVENNNILVNTTTGENGAGTAYPIQATGPYSGLVINSNNLTSLSRGPALGIYSQNYDGITDIIVTNNNIDVTGYATSNEYALVSGMELQDSSAKVYNNTIYSRSISAYDDANALYGISYAQYTSGTHTYDIRDNKIFTEGKYAVYLMSAKDSNVVGNTLYAHELISDEAVNIASGDNNVVRDNLPLDVSKLTVEVSNITVGQDATINITFNGDVNDNVTVVVDGEIYIVEVIGGFGNLTVSDLAAGDYKVTAILKSDVYGDFKNSIILNVAKLDSKVSVTVSDAELGKDAVIAVSIPEATGHVTVIVNGKREEIPLDENGNATCTIENISAGDYHVDIIYSGDNNHASANETISFTVDKLQSQINVTAAGEVKVGIQTTISVNVSEGATGIVIVNVGSTEYAIDLEKTNNITVVFDKAGEYSIVAKYTGDDNYEAGESETAAVVVSDKEAANIQVEIVSKDDLTVGDEVEIIVKADTNAELIVLLNGKELNPGSNGVLSASLNNILKSVEQSYKFTAGKAGIYNVTVLAKENDEYVSEVCSEVFLVGIKNATVEITPITDAKVGDNVTIEVTADSDGALTIKVNGETVTGVYEITKAGSYIITAESAATENYAAGFSTYTFVVEEEPVEPDNNVTVIVDGVEYPGELVNGTVTIETGLPDELAKAKEKIENLTDELEEAQANATRLAGELADANMKVENLTDELADAQANATRLAGELADAQANVTALAGELADANMKVENLTVELEEAQANVTRLAGELADANGKVENLTDELANATDKIVDLTAELADAQANVTKLAGELADANQTIEDLLKQLEEAKANSTNSTLPETVVVDGVEYPIEYVNGTATVETNKTAPVVPKSSEFSEITISDDLTISIVLKDSEGNVIVEAPITYAVNGAVNTTVTANDGKFTVKGENGALITINYAGDANITGTNTTLKLNSAAVPEVVKVAAQFNISNRAITINGYAVDGPAGEQGIYYATTLLDANGKPISNVYLEFAVNNKIYNRTTYENGSFNPYKLNMIRAGRYTMAFNFAGDDNYTNAFACVCVDLDKKPITIKAPAKTYKAATKTKKYTATLSTIPSVYDGKVYLSPKAVKLTVNGKTFTGKTNGKGQVTFKITNLNKKGTYKAMISYKGDKTYEEATKKAKLTIK